MRRVLFTKKFRILSHFLRHISSEILTNDLNNGIRKEIEEYWAKRLTSKRGCNNIYAASVLYPASIIHSENLRLLAIRDAVLRYYQMNDFQTLINDGALLEDGVLNKVPEICGKSKPVKVSQKWFLKTSKFTQDFGQYLFSKKSVLDDDLDRLHKSWAGKCDGFSFDCSTNVSEKLNIWVPNLSLIPQAEFVAIKPNSFFDHHCGETTDANGRLKMIVINPVTSKELPVYVREDLEYAFGRDTHLGVPSVFENDCKFAEKVGLKFGDANVESCISAEKLKLEFNRVGSQHGDWPLTQNDSASILVPLVHCNVCGFQPVPEQELPITLPPLPENLRNRDFEVFLKTNNWTRTVCPNCGGAAEREKTFIDPVFLSCVFSFRSDETNKLIPVDLFTCGGDKGAYQLYFTRFLAHILHSLGLCSISEPSKKLLFNYSFLHQTMSNSDQGKCLKFDEIIEKASVRLPKEFEANEVILSDIRNVCGCEFSHLLLLLSSRNEQFSLDPSVRTEMLTWQNNLWLTVREFINIRERPLAFVSPWINIAEENKKLKAARNESIRLATLEYCETLDLQKCLNVLRKLTNKLRTYTREARKLNAEYEKSLSVLIIMLAPIMPYFAATLWTAFTTAEGRLTTNDEEIAWNENVMLQKWPKIDDDYEIPVILRINSDFILAGGAIRCNKISELTLERAFDVAKKSRNVRKFLKKNRILNVHLNTVRNLQAELIIVAESNTKTQEIDINENCAKKEN